MGIGGYNIYLQYGYNRTNGMLLNENGNVTIGGMDYAASTNRLFVHGGAISGDSWTDGGQVMLVSSNDYYLALTTNESGYSELQSGQRNVGAKPLVLQKKGGNVGIGTTDPQYKLDVHTSSNAGTFDTTIRLYRATSGYATMLYQNATEALTVGVDSAGNCFSHVAGAHSYYFEVNGSKRMTIASDGAVTMLSTLSVGGNAHFTGLITADSGIKIGDATITWDASANALKIDKSVYSIGGFGTK
jgi:hypothetical protein